MEVSGSSWRLRRSVHDGEQVESNQAARCDRKDLGRFWSEGFENGEACFFKLVMAPDFWF